MASTELEILNTATTGEKMVANLTKAAAGRALNRRNFMSALGLAGTAAAAARSFVSPRAVQAAVSFTQTDVLNFALNLEYLEATFYSYVTQGVDLPIALTAGSGAITGAPAAKITFTGSNAAQITDLFNEIYYDELSHVLDLRGVLGSVAIARPALNLAAYAAVTATNTISLARLFEDVGVTAYAGAAAALSATNLTYAAQILAVEGFHAGALRLISIQNPTIAADYPTTASNVTFTGTTTAGSPTMFLYYPTATTVIAVASVVTGPGIPGSPTVTAVNGTANTAITGTFASGTTAVTALSSAAGLAVGQPITGTGIPAGTVIAALNATALTLTLSAATTAAGTKAALAVGTSTLTLSLSATASANAQTYIVGDTDTMDVAPYDPGTAALSAAGPTANGGFFATSGASTATAVTPAGLAFGRTTSQVLAIVYGAASVAAASGTSKGGFFPSGMNGVINTV